MTDYLLGVDGGGTKTAVLLADRAGTVLGRGLAASSNYQKVGFKSATQALQEAVQAAFDDARLPVEAPVAVCLGLAGIDTESDARRFGEWLARTWPQARGLVVNDAEIALAAGTSEAVGVALICGTGAIVVGRDAAGRQARADGWGYLLGDDGSGFAIGLAAMRAVLRALDGRGPATALTEGVLKRWGLATPEALMDFIYLQDASAATIATLSRVVLDVASAGDGVALEIVKNAAAELACSLHAVVTRLELNAGGSAAPCALAGGVVTNSTLMADSLLEAARARGLRLAPVAFVTEPVVGALRLAQTLLKNAPSPT